MTITWHKTFKPHPMDGDRRVVSKYLWFPKCLDGQYRWLGRESIEQAYYPVTSEFDTYVGWQDLHWCKS